MTQASDRFAEKMRERDVAKDTKLLGDFTAIYCKGNHRDATRSPIRTDGAALGVYGSKPPVVCAQCEALLAYSEKRRAFCPKDPKPFCNYCDTHCYKSDMLEYMRDVMRYAGPRSMLHGYAIEGIQHLLAGRAAKKAAQARETKTNERNEA